MCLPRVQKIAITRIGGEEVLPSTTRYDKGKVPYTREDKGKRKQ